MKHKIALVGFGTVGQGLLGILKSKRDYLMKKYGFDFQVVAVTDLFWGTAFNPDGLDLDTLLNAAASKSKFSRDLKSWDSLSMIKECNATVICELSYTNLETGEPAISHCRAAFETKKHVVTSNKGPAALAYRELKQLADRNGVQFLIEGTVMSGTPVINLAAGPLAGCQISKARGILNWTTNYILTQMEMGMDYGEALKKAQELGYAEADPTGDVEGYDARGKVTILANVVMEASLSISDIPCQGITRISPEDIRKAAEKDSRWKLIGSIENKNGKVMASVSPEMIPLSHPLAGIMGATNAITFTTDLLGDITVVGPGAGKTETGYSILTDLLKLSPA
jgi:homoserine dehydrogenase